MAEFSIILAGKGGNLCNMCCHYCSATGVSKKDNPGSKEWPIEVDYDALKKTMETNPIIKDAIAKKSILTINLWGGDPLMHTKQFSEIWDWIDKTFPNLKYHGFVSTNGLLLGAKHIQDWIYEEHKKHGLTIQLSHDGVGQFIRSKDFDPLYDPKTKDFCVKLVKDGILRMINATLNQYNCSPMANFAYFQKWRYDNHLENTKLDLIKLNHNNDAEYTGPFRLTGENLDRYMHEMEILWMNSYMSEPNDPYWLPYRGYFENQMKRWEKKKGEGGCESFSKGHKDWTWCVNTKGEYVFCQLCNDPKTNPNPNCEQSESCKHCEFRDYDDCHPCPDMVMGKECHYKKAYIRTVLRMKEFCRIVDGLKQENNQLRNQLSNSSCSCGNKQDNNCNASFYGVPTVVHP